MEVDALDALTRPISAFPGGERSRQSAQEVGEKIPAVSQEQARFSTDWYEADKGGIPSAQPQAITQLARKANHVERCNGTFRQRVSRLGRATLSFSKTLPPIKGYCAEKRTTSKFFPNVLRSFIRGFAQLLPHTG
jgi:insertion element IS1 protein InsB